MTAIFSKGLVENIPVVSEHVILFECIVNLCLLTNYIALFWTKPMYMNIRMEGTAQQRSNTGCGHSLVGCRLTHCVVRTPFYCSHNSSLKCTYAQATCLRIIMYHINENWLNLPNVCFFQLIHKYSRHKYALTLFNTLFPNLHHTAAIVSH